MLSDKYNLNSFCRQLITATNNQPNFQSIPKMTDQTSRNDTPPKVVVVMVPLPIQGHLNQLLHLSHLITSYGIPVHYAGSSSHNRQARHRLLGWDSESLSKIHFHDFRLPSYESPLPQSDRLVPFPAHFVPLLEASCSHLHQPVSDLLQELSTKFDRVIVIHDNSMAYVVQDVKLISNAEAYCFIPICAFTYFAMVWEGLPLEAKPFELDSKDDFDGIPSQEGCATQEMVDFILKQLKFLGFESGYVYNTSRVIDGRYVECMEKLSATNSQMKHFALGPFNPTIVTESESLEKNRHQCLRWLDEQEKGSVMYVSFGSTTSLLDDQIEELASGLERCGEKFMWVLRRADTNDVFADGDKVKRPRLPQGYEERVKDRGIVVKEWAPQLEILAHSSIGGFMSHCGWNSCMESISMGVPMLAWPMHSDQPKNAFFVTEVLKAGVCVRDWERRGELVSSSVIENAVKTLTTTEDGKEIRKKAAKLGEAVRESVAQGGVTCLERDSFIRHICR